MNEVEIPIKVSGLGAIKAELRELKGEIANATDPAEIARLSMAAGELKDKISDANEAVNVFATGSKFEQVSNGFAGIKDSIMSLDFEEAATKAKTFATTLSTVNPASILKGMGSFVTMLGTLGTAFVKLGVQILMNPLFLIVAAVVAIVVAIGFFLDKIGVLQVAIDYLMIPINAAIDGLKMFGDFLGITNYAEDEAAAKRKQEGAAASKRSDTAINETNALLAAKNRASAKAQESFNLADDAMGREIALMKAQGKDTTDLERTRLKASIAFQKSIVAETYATSMQIIEKNKLTLAELYATGERLGDFKAYNKLLGEQNKIITDNNTKQKAAAKSVLDLENDLKIFEQELINDRKKGNADANKDKVKGSKETTKIVIDHAANELEIKRKNKDQELANMKDGIEKEQAMIVEKYDRQAEDLIKNTKYSAAEKLKLQAYYDAQEKIENDDKVEANKLRLAQNERESMAGLIALRLEGMVDGEAKELAIQADKYKKLRDAAIADTKLTAEQLQEKLDIYNALEIAEDAKRQKAKDDAAKAKTDAANALYFEITATEQQKEIAALNAKYATEQELANGNQVILQKLQEDHQTALTQIEKDGATKRIEDAAAERDAKLTLANDITKGITDIGGMLIKDQEKLAKFNKASALVQIGIDTAKAISALVAASQSNALNGVTAGAAGIAQFASGIIQIATNIAKAKQLLTAPSTPVSAGGGGGGGGASGGGNTASMIPQAAQLFGQGNNSSTVSAGGVSSSSGGGNMMVTAVVSETQITNVQKKINMINKNAEL
jgi:hypothetical protein